MKDLQLTPNFHLSEFLHSDTALRLGIDNSPSDEHVKNLIELLAPGMQRVRDLLGVPVSISSGYRSRQLNVAVRGSLKSQHCTGNAADFSAPGFGTPRDICRHLVHHRVEINFDQLIFEGTWVHISFSREPRHSVLTAHFNRGRVAYTQGIA